MHEPPIFNGVERPQVDRVIIATTWREGGISGDWRALRKGFESRAPIAYFHISDIDALRQIPPGETEPTSTVGSDLFGVYGELGYKVLDYVDTAMALVPFVRVDYFDTKFRESDSAYNLPALLGAGHRPIPQVGYMF